MKRFLSIVLLIMVYIPFVFAGPFGLEMGMSYEQVKEACGGREPVSVGNGAYIITPTKTHPYFIRYIAWIDDIEGLNYIKAIGADIDTNGYGIELRSKFESLESSLSKSYGKCDRTSFLLPSSIWDEPDDWMKALEKKERYLLSAWGRKYGSTLPENITSIGLVASANSSSNGYITLEYEFSNNEKVEKAKKESDDSVF